VPVSCDSYVRSLSVKVAYSTAWPLSWPVLTGGTTFYQQNREVQRGSRWTCGDWQIMRPTLRQAE
jgi:hypothetical protein